MAICCRKGCGEHIAPISYDNNIRLCFFHFNKRNELAQKRNIKNRSQCTVCGAGLSEIRNSKYCSNKCKGIGMRILKEADKTDIHHHSYWINAENLIKQNPLQLNSINSLCDIVDLVSLYKVKAKFQMSCNRILGEKITSKIKRNEHKLRAFMHIDMSHLFPNSKGGLNIAKNILIAPSFINKLAKDKAPENYYYQEFNGFQSGRKRGDISHSLIGAIVKKHTEIEVDNMFSSIGKLPRIKNGDTRDLDISEIFNQVFIFGLLKSECQRLHFRDCYYCLRFFETLKGRNIEIKYGWIRFLPCYLDMIALLFFYALLRGDCDNYLLRIKRLVNKVEHARKPEKRMRALLSTLSLSRRYAMRYFSISSRDKKTAEDSMITVYGKVFLLPPSYITEEGYPKWIRSQI